MKKLKKILEAAFAGAPFPIANADLVAGAAMLEVLAQVARAIAAETSPAPPAFDDAAFFRSCGVTPPGEER
jgi:hypothetical protein